MGYFRDDQPLYELILDERQQTAARRDVAGARLRRARPDPHLRSVLPERERRGAGAAARIRRAAPCRQGNHLGGGGARACRRRTATESREPNHAEAIKAIDEHFAWVNAELRWVEKAKLESEPTHLDALAGLRARAPIAGRCRRPSAPICSAYYRTLRDEDGLIARRRHARLHRQRADVARLLPIASTSSIANDRIRPLVGLRAGQPAELFPLGEHAGRGTAGGGGGRGAATARGAGAHRRGACSRTHACADWRPSSAATGSTSGGSKSTMRSIASGSRHSTTSCARRCSRSRCVSCSTWSAESSGPRFPLRRSTRSSTRCWRSTTGCPTWPADQTTWMRVDDADKYGRGGLLPMAVFLTKNAPGLRTSPVKRGYWVVKKVLGEQIPPPPAAVPELPRDEAKLDLPLARPARAASREQGVRRLPRAVRFARPRVRRLRPGRRAAHEGSERPRGRRFGDVPRRDDRHRHRRLASVRADASPGRFRRQPVAQAARVRARPQPDAVRRSRSRACAAKLAKTATASTA